MNSWYEWRVWDLPAWLLGAIVGGIVGGLTSIVIALVIG